MSRIRFRNPWPHETHNFLDILKWKLGWLPEKPADAIVAENRPADRLQRSRGDMADLPESGWRVTWLGHASFLLQGCGTSILIDPIFSDHCFPLPIPFLRRRVRPPCALSDLPAIDAVLITHGHFDHLDLPTLRALRSCKKIVTAEGHARWLAGKLSRPVGELAWHDTLLLNERIKITATPAQHFTARTPFDLDRAHWCGWLIEGGGSRIWHAGDSGYCPAFKEIGTRYGPIDFGMIPIGAYQPRKIMKAMHMNPEEAVRAFQESGCMRAAAMHWGTFVLTNEPMQEPPLRLRLELERKHLPADVFTAEPVGSQWQVEPATCKPE